MKNTHANSWHFSSPSFTKTHKILTGPTTPQGTSTEWTAEENKNTCTCSRWFHLAREARSPPCVTIQGGLGHWDRKTFSFSPIIRVRAQVSLNPVLHCWVTFNTPSTLTAFKLPYRLTPLCDCFLFNHLTLQVSGRRACVKKLCMSLQLGQRVKGEACLPFFIGLKYWSVGTDCNSH